MFRRPSSLPRFGIAPTVVAVLCCAVFYSAGAQHAAAELIVGDSFEEYAPGNLIGENGAGLAGTGEWTGAYAIFPGSGSDDMNVALGSMIYTNGAVTVDGGTRHVAIGDPAGSVQSGNGVLARSFTPQTDTIYFSLLYQTTALVGDDFVQFLLNDDADPDNSASFIMAMNYQARMTAGGSNVTTDNSPDVPSLGQLMLLVGKVTKSNGASNYNRIDLFVNPASTTEPDEASATAARDSLVGEFDHFTVRTARLDTNDLYLFDALRIGTTYSDVVAPIQYTAVPEPSSLTLVALATTAYAWRRRRKGRRCDNLPVTADEGSA